MSGKLTNEDMIFLAKLPLSDKQLTELLKWAHTYKEEIELLKGVHTYKEEEKPKSVIESIFKCDMEKIKE